MRYAKVLPQLFLGSRPEIPADIDRLRFGSGITAVLNLQTDDDMRAVNLVWQPLENHYRTSGIQLCRVPVLDFDPVNLREKLPECVRALSPGACRGPGGPRAAQGGGAPTQRRRGRRPGRRSSPTAPAGPENSISDSRHGTW